MVHAFGRRYLCVMPGLGPGTHVCAALQDESRRWPALRLRRGGLSPAMTQGGYVAPESHSFGVLVLLDMQETLG